MRRVYANVSIEDYYRQTYLILSSRKRVETDCEIITDISSAADRPSQWRGSRRHLKKLPFMYRVHTNLQIKETLGYLSYCGGSSSSSDQVGKTLDSYSGILRLDIPQESSFYFFLGVQLVGLQPNLTVQTSIRTFNFLKVCLTEQ